MTASGGLLDFFILEAAELLERLDDVLGKGAGGTPDAEAIQRHARALRGSATMARLTPFADVANGLERVARGLRERSVTWDVALQGAVTGAVDDLKRLVHEARQWGDAQTARASARAAELARYAPTNAPGAGRSSAAAGAIGTTFFALEADQLAEALAGVRARPGDRAQVEALGDRVRRLRGVAALRDLPPLAEVVEGIEKAIRPLEAGGDTLNDAQHELLASATEVLIRASATMRSGDRPQVGERETARFAAAAAALEGDATDADRVVPIAELFFADEGPHVLTASDSPPTTPSRRFRHEMVSLAEHLRRLCGDARAATDIVSRDRLGRELRSALRTLRNSAESFSEPDVVRFVDAVATGAAALDTPTLRAVDQAAMLLSTPTTPGDELSRRLAELVSAPPAATPIGVPVVGHAAPTPAPEQLEVPEEEPPRAVRATPAEAARTVTVPTPADSMPAIRRTPAAPVATVSATPVAAVPPAPAAPESARPTPSGRELRAVLATGLSGLAGLASAPLTEPTPVDDDTDVVPVERLLYRGRAALDRARELRDRLRSRGELPDSEELAELLDLLDLVATE